MNIEWDQLQLAFETNDFPGEWFFDLETGAIVLIEDSIERVIENEDIELEEAPKWVQDNVEQASVLVDNPGRFVGIPRPDTKDAWKDMSVFVNAVADAELKTSLGQAIEGRGAFRHFSDTLRGTKIEGDWYLFKNARLESRMMNWLESIGVEASR